jgi:hypothetical protein
LADFSGIQDNLMKVRLTTAGKMPFTGSARPPTPPANSRIQINNPFVKSRTSSFESLFKQAAIFEEVRNRPYYQII